MSAGFDDPNRQPYAQLAQAFPQRAAAGAAPSQVTEGKHLPGGNELLASMRSATEALGDALKIESKVLPPDDPTSLASQPQVVGPELYYHAALLHESRNNIPDAVAHYQRALEIEPNNVRCLISYARLLDRQTSFPQAEQLYLQAARLSPRSPVPSNDLGMMYARQGKLDAALQALQRAVELQPDNQRYRNNIAIVLIDAGRNDEAFAHLATVHGEAVAHYNLAFLLSRRRMNDRATSHLRQALSLNPNLQAARELLGQIRPPTSGMTRLPVDNHQLQPAVMTGNIPGAGHFYPTTNDHSNTRGQRLLPPF